MDRLTQLQNIKIQIRGIINAIESFSGDVRTAVAQIALDDAADSLANAINTLDDISRHDLVTA